MMSASVLSVLKLPAALPMPLAPDGRSIVAQGVSPGIQGGDLTHSPGGAVLALICRLSGALVPCGDLYPGLTPWASFLRPYGTIVTLFMELGTRVVRSVRSLLKKGTGSELMADYASAKRSRRGACPLFQLG
jgi:hypothetical protein